MMINYYNFFSNLENNFFLYFIVMKNLNFTYLFDIGVNLMFI